MIANAIFLKIFWHFKVTQPFMCFRVNQVYIFLSQSNIFIISPRWIFISSLVGFVVSPVGFLISPVENLLLDLTPENLAFSPASQAVPTGLLGQGVVLLQIISNVFQVIETHKNHHRSQKWVWNRQNLLV